MILLALWLPLLLPTAEAFAPAATRPCPMVPATRWAPLVASSRLTRCPATPRDDDNDDDNNDNNNARTTAPTPEEPPPRTPLLARLKDVLQRRNSSPEDTGSIAVEEERAAPAASPSTMTATVTATPTTTPEEQAKRLQRQAEILRLEAERLDAELTLTKIDRLERDIQAAQRHPYNETDPKAGQRLQQLLQELDMLQRKYRGEPVTTVAVRNETASSITSSSSSSSSTTTSSTPRLKVQIRTPQRSNDTNLENIERQVQQAPSFLLKTMAAAVDIPFETAEDINKTELVIRLDQMRRNDFSFLSRPKPQFTPQQVQERTQAIQDGTYDIEQFPWAASAKENAMTSDGTTNQTELAIQSLQFEYYVYDDQLIGEEEVQKILEDEEWLQPVMAALNMTAVDAALETLYPKCTRKLGRTPTDAQVQQLVSAVLPKAGFASTSKPERVSGGFIIRGTNKLENGDALVDAIDRELAKSSLADKLTVLYTTDHSFYSDDSAVEQYVGGEEIPPILYVLGPDIARDQRRVLLSITSALGLATTWYLSIYPFLLNPVISKRLEEDLALVDAGMVPDVSWITDLSVPLFTAFVGLQILHEIGHRVAAAANGIKLSFPAFVPSIITGITSTVTSFKQPPKNFNAMFDISIAGPLTGMIASIIVIAVGSSLTLTSDPSTLPALPLQILRQSTLGGGIIESIMGAGVLSVPVGAENSAQVAAMTISLHPVAVAGYISLVVNALSLLPVGTTDGGRVGLALFGRGGKLALGNVFLAALLLIGLGGSDLFLLYFGFVLAFQSGNEIPARNEADPLSFERVLVATAGFVLMLLTLIPVQ